MSTMEQSHKRLRAESWITEQPKLASTSDPSAKYQPLSGGSGTYAYDEYSVLISGMPSNVSAGEYIRRFSNDFNGTVNNGLFNAMNMFSKRTSGDPKLGDIYDIDIAGPDNGSIVVVAISSGFGTSDAEGWFDIQTITCKKYGTHPEYGAREFGFEKVDQGYKFYTRGVSRPENALVRIGGKFPQAASWSALMKGISTSISQLGGSPKANSFAVFQEFKAN
ncbi:MAG: hypothetical protein JY451_13970 [Erythrobacter sp.]|nr:MAG: hypothetical protein JY451_13970 [Erythrobacter sp.]